MSPEPDKEETDEKESCVKKVAELEASLKERQHLEETYLNQLKYAQADLENLQKQVQRRIEEGVARGNERLLVQLLPIDEELDLAVEAAKKEGNAALLEGIKMVKKKLEKVLNCEGLSYLEVVGKPFDPHLHEAVQEVETCDHPDGTVVEEVRKGYLLKGKVLRASIVKVARNLRSKEVEKAKENE
jgi:molecular chaperone GrpE